MKRQARTPEQKMAIIEKVKSFLSQGLSQNVACAEAGVNAATFVKWRDKLARSGGDISGLKSAKPPGRPRSFGLGPVISKLKRWEEVSDAERVAAPDEIDQFLDALPDDLFLRVQNRLRNH